MDDPELRSAVAAAVAYLESEEARASLARGPYWPKWSSPWWHLLALDEAGATASIPRSAAQALLAATRDSVLPFFPRSEAEVPPGKDAYFHTVCHCALGCLGRVLLACGLEIEEGIPWARGWFLRYQLPDGGWNCMEDASRHAPPKSSISSTLPPLEYLLALGDRRALSGDELAALDRGAAYLLRHQLVCSAAAGALLRPEWLTPTLPRFYEYDALRGLAFVVRWARARARSLPRSALAVAREGLERYFEAEERPPPRRWHAGHETRIETAPGVFGWGPAGSFPLLRALNETAAGHARLVDRWREVRAQLDRLGADGWVS